MEKQTEVEQHAVDLFIKVGDLLRHLDAQCSQICYGKNPDPEIWGRGMCMDIPVYVDFLDFQRLPTLPSKS